MSILSRLEIMSILDKPHIGKYDYELVAEAQHKRDQEDFQKQKQEMWNEGLELIKSMRDINDAGKAAQMYCDFLHKWGIEQLLANIIYCVLLYSRVKI